MNYEQANFLNMWMSGMDENDLMEKLSGVEVDDSSVEQFMMVDQEQIEKMVKSAVEARSRPARGCRRPASTPHGAVRSEARPARD